MPSFRNAGHDDLPVYQCLRFFLSYQLRPGLAPWYLTPVTPTDSSAYMREVEAEWCQDSTIECVTYDFT